MRRSRSNTGVAAGGVAAGHLARPRRLWRGGLAGVAAAASLLIVAVPGSAARGKRVTYRGKSSQGLVVRLSRPFRYGRTFRYQATLSCSDGTSFTEGVFSDDVRVRRRRFHDRYRSHRGAEKTRLTGRLRGRSASGTLRVVERFSPSPNAQGFQPLDPAGTVVCDSGAVTWKARSRR